ncbi:MAG: SRPBCC family protein [Flavobacteriia bacterium]|nr:SRPBCC family protein [Flavobacteriia bacterium]
MRYTYTLQINKPKAFAVEKFQDEEGIGNWMEGFQRIERISGEPGKVGARSDFFFTMRDKEMKIEETIIEESLPDQIKFAYQSPMAYNEVEVIFEELGPNEVRVISNNYFKFSGGMKWFSWLFKRLFVKQTASNLHGLKNWVESIE